MFRTTILPDFNKLVDHFSFFDKEMKQLHASGGLIVDIEYMSEPGFSAFSDGLKTVLEQYDLQQHHHELLYLTVIKNEQIRERYDAYLLNYNEGLTSKEVAKFLLAFKQSKPNQQFHLSAKPLSGTITIKDTPVARWMAETVYKQIEERNFPLGVFGEKLVFDLFGDDFINGEPIALNRLEAAANQTPRKPTVRVNKLFVEMCSYLQVYLINQTHLTLPTNVKLSDAHANLFFDILELIGYLDRNKINSEPKDFVHAMFRNNLKS